MMNDFIRRLASSEWSLTRTNQISQENLKTRPRWHPRHIHVDLVRCISSDHVPDRLVSSGVEFHPRIDREHVRIIYDDALPVRDEAFDLPSGERSVR